jgi:hypothetical protein
MVFVGRWYFRTSRNTAMNIQKIALIAAAAAALAPAIGNAAPESDAINACARAFATTLAPPGADAPAYKVSYRSAQHFGSMLEFYARDYTFDLHVNDRKTGLAVAHARCTTDVHGSVVALSPIPLGS